VIAARLALIGFAGLLAQAQSLSVTVYSEFRRIEPTGEIVESDRGGKPREILSPAVVRNGWSSFRVVVTAPPGKDYFLYTGQNPNGAVEAHLYRELHERRGGRLIPDSLERIELPYRGSIPEARGRAARQVDTFWLDVWVAGDAPMRRVRLELQVNVGEEWFIYALELRVQYAVIPKTPELSVPLADVTGPADLMAVAALKGGLCGGARSAAAVGTSPRSRIRRNALQDVALARSLEASLGRQRVRDGILAALGARNEKAWCASEAPPAPESYLKVRDFLYRAATE
jgi:hypothetical protein